MPIRRLLAMLWARKALILTILATTMLATFFVGSQLPPRYEGEARIIVEAMRPDPVTGQVIDSKAYGAYMNTQLQLIQSYRVTGQVVDMAGMTNSPQLAEIFQASGASTRMDFRRWIADQLAVRVGARPEPDSNILTLIFVSGDPAEAAAFADLFRTAFIDQSRIMKVDPANRNAQATRATLERVQTRLGEAEKRLADFERANGLVAAAFPMGLENERLMELARKLPSAVPQQDRRAGVGAAMTARLNAAARVAALDASIASARATLGPNHPQVVALSSERNAVAAAAGGGAGVFVQQSLPAAATGAVLSAAYSEAQRRALAARGTIDEAGRLAADVFMLREQMRDLSEQAMAYDMVAGSMESGLVKLGDIEPPRSPSFPKWPILMAWAVVIGLGYGIPIALISELRRLRVREAGDVSASGVPVIGRAPRPERPPLPDRLRASFRSLRNNLRALRWRRAPGTEPQSA